MYIATNAFVSTILTGVVIAWVGPTDTRTDGCFVSPVTVQFNHSLDSSLYSRDRGKYPCGYFLLELEQNRIKSLYIFRYQLF